VKGETIEELEGALTALQGHLHPVRIDPLRPAVSIPSYNGARHSANLTALLACLLADAGVQVVVHGVKRDPKRTTTAEVMQAMGLPCCTCIDDAGHAIARSNPAFVPIDVLSPRLAALLALRWRLGVRNIGHTLAKLLNATSSAACLRICAYTHPEFNQLQHRLFERSGAAALISRGTEGEVVASTRRAAQIDWVHDGACELLVPAQAVPMRATPGLPPAQDACATALWIQSVLAGERPVPEAIAQQVDAVLRALVPTRQQVPA
jgi:anthranilate phosphoribosyltransferase